MKLRIPLGSEALELEITVCRVDELLPHEEVIPKHLKGLLDGFARSEFQRNPVIVDAQSNLILDGTHRWAAMKELGFAWIVACKVDYMSPLVGLDTWARVYDRSSAEVEKVLRGFGAELVDLEAVKGSDLIVIHAGRAHAVPHQGLKDAFEKLRRLEWELAKLTELHPTYIPRSSWHLHVHKPLLVLPPEPAKEDVLRVACEGCLLPPKSTRHIIPARPMGVNVPLKLLRRRSLDVELIEEILRQRRIFLLKPPVLLDREYQETLLMFA